MRGLKLLAVGLMLSNGLCSQIIDNRGCKAFSDDPFFNETFVRINNLKAMKGTISTKNKLRPIQTRGLTTYYSFDRAGHLDMQYSTRFKTPSDMDTSFVRYYYSDDDQISLKRLNDNYGFYSYHYNYDSTGQICSEEYCRDENVGSSPEDFKLGKQTIIVSETFKNIWINDQELKRVYYNNYGKPYQEKYQRWDDKGYLIEEEIVLLLSRKRNVITYTYNEKGHVVKRVRKSNVTGNSELQSEYKYDGVGNLIEINEYRNGKHILKKEVLYNDSMLIKAIISFDVATEFMTIIKFEYTFYDEVNTSQNQD